MDLKVNFLQDRAIEKFTLSDSVVGFEEFKYRHKKFDANYLTKKKLLVLINELNQENMELEKRVTDLETSIYNIEEKLREHNDYFNELEVI